MAKPTMTDYVHIIFTLLELFLQQQHSPRKGRPFTFTDKAMILLFTIFQFRRVFRFKTQRRWLEVHPEILSLLGWKRLPHRTTLSRRYKKLYDTIQAFVAFVGEYASDLDPAFSHDHLAEDKSLFKALGPVWHQSYRKLGRIPKTLRNLDTDAT